MAEGMNVFLRGVRRMNRPLKGIPFTPRAVGSFSVDMIPSTVILISVAVEDVLAFELALGELGWELRMGIEKHRVTVSSPPQRRPATGGPGIQGGPSSGAEGGPRAEADEYAEEEAIDNAQMDEDMDMNTDKSKNNGKDKDSNEEISL